MPRLVLALVGALLCAGAACAPHAPKDDAVVLERLPLRPRDPAALELRELRAAQAARPQDADAAAELAHAYFALAMADGDPRYVGYAEAALRRWAGEDAPAEILFLRGVLKQYRHAFAAALADLQRALERDPAHVGARAWRAAIMMVQADYAGAAKECAALLGKADELQAVGCKAYVDAATGGLRPAYTRLAAALRDSAQASDAARLWSLTRLAEMAIRLDDAAAAERHFRDALALGGNDNFLLAAYADFLLDRGRPQEVVSLLKDWVRSDTLLLRLALAERRLRLAGAEPHARALGERFAAAALRGERLHLQEEARFLLHVRGDAKAALAAAIENYQTQREPRDAAILLEAAATAGEPPAAAPALRWLRESRFESGALERLAAKLK